MADRYPDKTPPQSTINHPSQPGWLDPATHEVGIVQRMAMAKLYRGTSVDVETLFETMNAVTFRRAIMGYSHEQANLGHLYPTTDEMDEYRHMAGHPERAADYLCWFGRMALASFDLPDPTINRTNPDKTALLIGEQLQAGDWKATTQLDALIRGLPEQLWALDSGLRITAAPESAASVSYLYLPIHERQRGDVPRFGELRRRRPVADVHSGDWRVEVFKESVMLMVHSQMDPDHVADIIAGDYTGGRKQQPQKNDRPSMLAGAEVEYAIKNRRRPSRAVLPISAEYLMLMRRPVAAE